jgi:hypothetical protein
MSLTWSCSGEAPQPFSLDGGTDADTDADSDADSDADGDTDGDTDGDADADSDSDSDADSDADSDSDCQGNGHDEDGDGLDDNCDNCPTYPNADQDDGDGDEVGDACEAAWNEELLESVEIFDPLLDSQGQWNPDSEQWSWGGDSVAVSMDPYGTNNYREPFLEEGIYSVETTFHFGEQNPGGDSYAGLFFASHEQGFPFEQTVWITCLFERDSNRLSAWILEGNSSISPIDGVDVSVQTEPAGWHKVRAYYNGLSVLCTYEDEGGGYGELVLDEGDVWPEMAGMSGLRIYNESATFTSWAVYR